MLRDSERALKMLRRLSLLAVLVLVGLSLSGVAHAAEEIALPELNELELVWPSVWAVFICAIIGLLFGAWWFAAIMRESPGSQGMIAVSRAVQEGAWAYLKRQIKTMIWFVIIIAIGLIFLYKGLPEFQYRGAGGIPVIYFLQWLLVVWVASRFTKETLKEKFIRHQIGRAHV